uniref:Uncharacterized protein n=1 Tax=Opuntia streptacantha TaxID=393608 RepID=A0A7C9E9D5_OPUST
MTRNREHLLHGTVSTGLADSYTLSVDFFASSSQLVRNVMARRATCIHRAHTIPNHKPFPPMCKKNASKTAEGMPTINVIRSEINKSSDFLPSASPCDTRKNCLESI